MAEQKSAYEQIQALYGMEDFKRLADRLCAVAENKKQLMSERFVLPRFLFAAAPGCGVTTHLRLFAQLLYELKLQRFEGDQRVFEYVFPHDLEDGKRGLHGLLQRLTVMAGFRSMFRGVVGLDIDAWVEHANDAALDPLLAFAADYARQLALVYIVELRSERDLEPLIARLANETPLEVVRFTMPTVEELLAYLEMFLQQRGCVCEDAAKAYLLAWMPVMRESKRFDGLQTLDNLADEIMYRYLISDHVQGGVIPQSVLTFIAEKGGFIDRLKSGKSAGGRRTIGFT